jgi:cytochrome c
MSIFKSAPLGVFSGTFLTAVLTALLTFPAAANHVSGNTAIQKGHAAQLVLPIMNPERGKKLFVDKGCVACHAVNGVGGHDAPNMDAHNRMGLVHPFDFAAKMWNHAPAMIAAQESAFGEQVYFTGSELADIIAFVHDDDAQHSFSKKDLTARARKMMQHGHGGASPPDAHAKEIGHDDSKSPPHKD